MKSMNIPYRTPDEWVALIQADRTNPDAIYDVINNWKRDLTKLTAAGEALNDIANQASYLEWELLSPETQAILEPLLVY